MAVIEMKAVLACVFFSPSRQKIDDDLNPLIPSFLPKILLSTLSQPYPSALIVNFEFEPSVPDQIAKPVAAITISKIQKSTFKKNKTRKS